MKQVLGLFCFLGIVSAGGICAAAENDPVGKVRSVNPSAKEVVISSPKAAEQFLIGDRLVIKSGDGRDIVLTVSFPMMSVAKCTVSAGDKAALVSVRQGAPVFRWGAKTSVVTKYFETWDAAYLSTSKKVRFTHELSADRLSSAPHYFTAVFDSRGMLLSTTEMTSRKKIVSDFYRDDHIVRKEYHNADTEAVERILVYSYYPSGGLSTFGDLDARTRVNKVIRYAENGSLISRTENSDVGQ